jgi:signal transduction histidine kinase
MKRMLDVAIASVRRISTELRPLILDDLGFAEAVQWQVDEVAKRSGLKIEIDLPAHESVKNEAQATAMFRIVQESLTNIVRHAKASQVRISLVQEGEQLHLRIQDNGQGMTGPGRTGGIGLVSMRERVSALGGVFNWLSVPEQGVLVEVILPMHLEPQEGATV